MSERRPRLFIGIAVDEFVRAACARVAERLRATGIDARYVVPENYHLTLIFLGNVDAEQVPGIEATLAEVALRHPPFSVTLERVGAFPHERRPRVIFLGSRGVVEAYRGLAQDVGDACARLGFAREGDAVPHVTLARVPERTRLCLPLIDVETSDVCVDSLTLFDSIPHEGRTRYEVRTTLPLAR